MQSFYDILYEFQIFEISYAFKLYFLNELQIFGALPSPTISKVQIGEDAPPPLPPKRPSGSGGSRRRQESGELEAERENRVS